MTPGYPRSYYAATAAPLAYHPPPEGALTADVCVIGGGYTGLSAALHLARRGYDTVLVEAERLGWGASGRNGGQVGTGQRKDQAYLTRLVGREEAQRLFDLAEEAKALVRQLIETHAIDCDYRPGVLSAAVKPAHAPMLEAHAADLAETWGYDGVRYVPKAEMAEMLGTGIYHGGALDSGAGHLHPLNYALGLARAAEVAGARLFEGTRVTGYETGRRTTVRLANGAAIEAGHVVLACNGYLGGLEKRLAGRIMPINNYIAATEPLGPEGARALIRDGVAVADTKYVIDYYRLSADHRLLFGGGETYSKRFPRDIARLVRKPMLRVFPQLASTRIDYAWGGTLAITLDRLPSFGRLPGNVFYAQGYSGQGVALATLAGKLIAEAVGGTAERFDVFARLPQPRFPGGTLLRWPGLVAGMLYFALRDRLP